MVTLEQTSIDNVIINGLRGEHHLAIDALEKLMSHYTVPLLRFAKSFTPADAEDIVQDVFFGIWDSRNRIVLTGSLRGYLFGAVRRKALLRKRHDDVVDRAADNFLSVRASPGMGVPPSPPDQSLDDSELRAALEDALRQLSERARSVLTLRWMHELTYPEIAEALGISPDAAKKQGQRAEEAVRPLLEQFKNR